MLAAAALGLGYAQDATSFSFEVATIRESVPGKAPGAALKFSSDRLEIRDMTLQEIISIAYDLGYGNGDRVIGGPEWIRTQRFDVMAKEDEATTRQIQDLPKSEQGAASRQLIRDLLAERFGLKVHRAPRVLTTYTLEVARGGPKLSPAVLDPHLPAGIPQNRVDVRGGGWLEAHDTDMALFVKVLGSQAEMDGRTVVDGTGLKQAYNFTLKWTPPTSSDAESSDTLPSLFSALQEQLGLRIASRKTSVDTVFIDAVDRPSAN